MRVTSRIPKLLVAFSCWVLCAGVASEGNWSPFNEILRANADGTHPEVAVPRERALALDSVAIDPALGPDPMYWPAMDPNDTGGFFPVTFLLRGDLDGTNIRGIVNFGWGPVHVDSGAASVFFTGASDCQPCDSLFRVDSSGANLEMILNSVQVNGFDIDPVAEKIYWQGNDISFEPKMWVVDYDGSNLQELFPSDPAANVALDRAAGKLYWTAYQSGVVRRSNLDGSDMEDVLVGLDGPYGLVLDPDSGRMWWSESNAGTVSRANLDGSEATPILTGLDSPAGLEFLSTSDPGGGKIYVVANPGDPGVIVPAANSAGVVALILLVLTTATTLLLRRRRSTAVR